MTDVIVPREARSPVDVYKAGRLAGHMWRLGDVVTFRHRDEYLGSGGTPVAFSLPASPEPVETTGLRIPAFFAGLLPEGETRRRQIQRAFHLAEEDELGFLALVGADTVGDVQVVPSGQPLPDDVATEEKPWAAASFLQMWEQLPGSRYFSALPGVQSKMSARSRSLHGGAAGGVILKLPLEGWRGVLRNERFFMAHAADVGLTAPAVRVVSDRDGNEALEVVRFDRATVDGRLVRFAQEDASQVLGLRPGEKYDPDARTVVHALATHCASPRLAARDLFHQLVYSYAIGNNDVHAKNLSILRGASGLWTVSPVYDVLNTWLYESDHRFHPPVRDDGPHDTVTLKHWLRFAADIGLPEKAARRIIGVVTGAVPALLEAARGEIDLPTGQLRDLERVVRKRARDLAG